MTIHVVAPGLFTSLQDLGRHGYAHLGVGLAGAMDRTCMRMANLLVGNDDGEATLEITLRGPKLRFEADAMIALSGGAIDSRCAAHPLPMWRPVRIRAGSEIDCGTMTAGSRTYLAVGGGFDVISVLGSRSADINSGIGPLSGKPLTGGDALPLRKRSSFSLASAFEAPAWSIDPSPWFDERSDRPVGLIPGAHFSRLDAQSQRAVFEQEFIVGSQSNRVGYRLAGPSLKLREPLELISEGTVPGTVQLPPSGESIVLMTEAPTTGGYPRIAHVAAIDLGRLAQRRPGQTLRFVEVSLHDAQTRYLQREREIFALRRAVSERLKAWAA